jgi:transposase-like protein
MPIGVPFGASGREPKERVREIPPRVKRACLAMIEQGIDRVAAAKQVGLRADSLRRWLREREVLAFLRQNHDYHLASLCAANPTKLAEIRDTSPNWTSRVQAIRTMAELGEEVSLRRAEVASPGITINIIGRDPALPQPSLPLIDVAPQREPEAPLIDADPIFRMP